MMDLGPHAPFILSAWGTGGLILTALALNIWREYRHLTSRLKDMKARGITRRSDAME